MPPIQRPFAPVIDRLCTNMLFTRATAPLMKRIGVRHTTHKTAKHPFALRLDQQNNFRQGFLQDPSVYPLIAILGAGLTFMCAMGKYMSLELLIELFSLVVELSRSSLSLLHLSRFNSDFFHRRQRLGQLQGRSSGSHQTQSNDANLGS